MDSSCILASAGGAEDSEDIAAIFTDIFRGWGGQEDAFAFAATKLGLLLRPNTLDADSAGAMWQEANFLL